MRQMSHQQIAAKYAEFEKLQEKCTRDAEDTETKSDLNFIEKKVWTMKHLTPKHLTPTPVTLDCGVSLTLMTIPIFLNSQETGSIVEDIRIDDRWN